MMYDVGIWRAMTYLQHRFGRASDNIAQSDVVASCYIRSNNKPKYIIYYTSYIQHHTLYIKKYGL